jgi:hypothetical protein
MNDMDREFVQFVYDTLLYAFNCSFPYAYDPWAFSSNFKSASADSILPWTTNIGIKIIPTLLDTHPTAKSHAIIEVYGGKYTAILPPTQADKWAFTLKLMTVFGIANIGVFLIICYLI